MNYINEIRAFMDLVESKQLSAGQIALWYALMHLNNKCAWAQWFTAPNKRLELLTGTSRQGIVKNRNILKQYGMIDFKTNGSHATSYLLKSLQQSFRYSCQQSLQQCCPLNKQDKTKQKESIEKQSSFEQFWAAYPKKAAKQDALKAWDKLTVDESLLVQILAGIMRLRTSAQWCREAGRFIPYPATFLNGRRWNDESKEGTADEKTGRADEDGLRAQLCDNRV